MPSNERNASRSNKRRRVAFEDGGGGGSAAPPSGGSAAGATVGGSAAGAPTLSDEEKLKSALGSRLEPLMGILATQPTELSNSIISKSKEMLALVTAIRQRVESSKAFDSPPIDPATGKPFVDEARNDKPFIPNSCQINGPIKISSAYNDDSDLLMAKGVADKAWEAAIAIQAAHAKMSPHWRLPRDVEPFEASSTSCSPISPSG